MSSSEKKTILFNNLVTTNKTRKNNEVKKEKPISIIKPNVLKKSLLEKIKQHQQNEQIKENRPAGNNPDIEFQDNFLESLEYLNKLADKQKQKQKQKKHSNNAEKNKTLKKPLNRPTGLHNVSSEHIISIELPDDFDKPPLKLSNMSDLIVEPIINNTTNDLSVAPINKTMDSSINIKQLDNMINVDTNTSSSKNEHFVPNNIIPSKIQSNVQSDTPYGCLKGGSKPTYRQYYNHTLKNTPSTKHHTTISNKYNVHRPSTSNTTPRKIKILKKKTKRSTYKLGRIGNKVSVLIKNNATRRKIKREHGILKQKSINEIKKFLYDKNLIRIGSTAPNDVLRTIYEQSILAGDITNVEAGIALHNFVNK